MATDPNMDPLMWSLGGNDSGDFTLTENAGNTGRELKFMAVPNYELPDDEGGNNVYNVTVNVEDDEGMSATLTVTVTVTNVNDAPSIFNLEPTATFPENGTGTVVDADVVDVDGDDIMWSLDSTDDGALFNISTTGGEISFKISPNFEMPTDTGDTAMNNTYVVPVRATDDGTPNLDDTHTITITVTNVDEPGTVTVSGALFEGEQLTAAVTDIDGSRQRA